MTETLGEKLVNEGRVHAMGTHRAARAGLWNMGPRFRGDVTRGDTARANYVVDRSGHNPRA
jgi:hypothetical protein